MASPRSLAAKDSRQGQDRTRAHRRPFSEILCPKCPWTLPVADTGIQGCVFFPVHIQSLKYPPYWNLSNTLTTFDMYISPSVFPSDPGHFATSEYIIRHPDARNNWSEKLFFFGVAVEFYDPCQSVILSQHGRPGRYLFQAAEEFHHHLRPCMGLIFKKTLGPEWTCALINGQNVFRIIYGYLWYHVHHCPYMYQFDPPLHFRIFQKIHRAWHNCSQARQSVQRSHCHRSISVRSTWW